MNEDDAGAGLGPAQLEHADPALACFVLYTLEHLARAARKLGLIARVRSATPGDLRKIPLPAIASATDGGAFILLRIEEDSVNPRYLVQYPDRERPAVLSSEEFDEAFLAGQDKGRLLLLTSRERVTGEKRPFDIAWFIPALVKYRRALRDVIIGSFFLQLMGLVSPIFFQLVIDKVLVHHSLTTLEVLAFGLAVVMIWETALSALRNWLFAHTSNRVDAELSANIFRHLVNLPLSYFESRRVGDSIARVRELETIREFLTSNAVTVVIDLFFTIVFFVVMYLYSPFLTLIVALTIPIYVLISVFITPPLRARSESY
jgi:ATP-binding cassette, subfamily B, bacterial HlyB/CyaB